MQLYFFRTNKNNLIKLFFIALLLVIALSPLKLIALVSILLAGGFIINIKADYFYRSIIFFGIFLSINTILASLFFLFKIDLNVGLIFFIYILLIGLFLLKNKRPVSFDRRSILFNFVKIFFSIFILLILVAPILSSDKARAMSFAFFGGDNVSHIELLKAVETSRGYFYMPYTESEKFMNGGLSAYPQGLHINMYIFNESIKDLYDLNTHYKYTVMFYSFTSLIFILFGWMLVFSIKNYASSDFIQIIPGFIVTLILCSGVFFSLFALGSHSQVMSLYLLMLMFCFITYSLRAKSLNKKLYYSTLSIIMLIGISFTWLLLLPLAASILAVLWLADNIKELRLSPKKYLWFLVILVLLGPLFLIQPFIQLMYSHPQKLGIIEPGYSVEYSLIIISALFVLSLIILLVIRLDLGLKKLLSTSLVLCFIFSAVIYAYQYIQVGSARYYLYKTLFTLILIISIIFSIFFGDVLRKYTASLSYKKMVIVVLLLFISGSFLISYNITNNDSFFKLRTSGSFNPEMYTAAVNEAVKKQNKSKTILTIGSCNREQDHVLTRLIGAFEKKNNKEKNTLLIGLLSQKKENLLNSINNYKKETGNDLIIISSNDVLYEYLKLKLPVSGIEYIDLNSSTINLNSCSEAVK